MGSPPGRGGLRRCRPDAVGSLVLDVPGRALKVGHMDGIVLTGVVVRRLSGGHHKFCGSGSGTSDGDGGSRGEGGRDFEVCGVSCVLCVVRVKIPMAGQNIF